MKKVLYVLSFIAICTIGYLTSTTAHTITQSKFALVNMGKIFQQLPQVKVIAKKLEEEFKDRANTIQNMELNFQKQMQHLQYDGSAMNNIEHNKLEQEIILQRQKLANEIQLFENDKQHRQIEEQNKLLALIRDIVRKIAINENYEMVFDADAIIYDHNLKDMTDTVIKNMNSK
ncbi:MAG: OmpH family outer membrane protein [Candidatus Dasytiphilus stammeri]